MRSLSFILFLLTVGTAVATRTCPSPVPGTRSPIECQMKNMSLRNGDPIYISRENRSGIVICSVSSHTLSNLQPADTVPIRELHGIFTGDSNDTLFLSVVVDQVSDGAVIEFSGQDRAKKNSARSFCFQVIFTESATKNCSSTESHSKPGTHRIRCRLNSCPLANDATVYISDRNASSHVVCSAPKSQYESLGTESTSSPEVMSMTGYRNSKDTHRRLLLALNSVQSATGATVRINGILGVGANSGPSFVFHVIRVVQVKATEPVPTTSTSALSSSISSESSSTTDVELPNAKRVHQILSVSLGVSLPLIVVIVGVLVVVAAILKISKRKCSSSRGDVEMSQQDTSMSGQDSMNSSKTNFYQ